MNIRWPRIFTVLLTLSLLLATVVTVAAGPVDPVDAALTPPASYLTACAGETPPPTCYTVDGFQAPDFAERTTWVLINDSGVDATFSFYLYDEVAAVTLDEIVQTEIITSGGVFVYPGLNPFTPLSPNPLTGVFTSTASMTLQIVGPTTRCPRAPLGNVTCTEVRVPAGATTYSFYNYQENPSIVWIHQLYLDGVAQPSYSDIMSGYQIKQYPTGIIASTALRTSAATPEPRFKALAHQFTGGPFPPHFMGWRLRLAVAFR